MCTIFAYEGSRLDKKGVLALLERTKMRGPDAERIYEPVKGCFMAFQRLSIMGLEESGMQPFQLDELISITNGEIYGFRKIRKELEADGYVFASGSDCEVMLPLYRKYGTEMFNLLDAEFATVIYDPEKGFIAARDPIGIRPLFYGYDEDGKMAFASEARLLEGLCDKIIPFPPGHLFCSLVCAIASHILKRPIRTFAIGMEKDPIDAKYAQIVADYIHSEHTLVTMTKEQVLSSLEEVIRILATYDITTIRASMGMYLLCKWIHENTDIRVLLTGEVSDELFGYKYTDFAPSAAEFQKESEKRIRELYAYDVLRADRCIADNSLEARVPFGDLDFASYVLSINPKIKMNRTGMGKYLLRKAFDDGNGWLPQSILFREKAAFSDAVGHSLVDDLKEYADELYKGKDWKQMCLEYPEEGRPFTTESLLYRSIFEKYYPGQSQMIPGFWMPNKSWEGCNVSDPSARVLSNYGKSGE